MRKTRTRLTAADIVAPPVAPDRLAEYRRFGYISDQTMSASVVRAARQWGSQPAVIEGGHQLTYQELLELVERAAAWLAGAGIGPGDVVCWQTPNWWEAHVLGLAIWHAGAVSCPIAPFYREHGLRQVIEQVRPAAVVTAETFRGFAHAEAFDDLLAGAGLGDVAASCCAAPGRAGRRSTRSSRTAAASSPPPSGPTTLPDPLHVRDHLGRQGGRALVAHVARRSPPAGRCVGPVLGGRRLYGRPAAAHHRRAQRDDDPAVGRRLRGAVRTVGRRRRGGRHHAPPGDLFGRGDGVLQESTEAARAARVHLPLRMFACGGAAVPRASWKPVRSKHSGRAGVRHDELPTVTVMNRAYPFDLRAETDGAIAPGVQVRVVGTDGEPLAAGCAGELLVRGPEQMLGYLDPDANRAALDDAGWFSTGDVGLVDGAGFVDHHRAVKDVINRGGRSSPPATSKTCSSRTPRCVTPLWCPDPTSGSVRSRWRSSCSTSRVRHPSTTCRATCTPPDWPAKRPPSHGISWTLSR